MSSIRVLQVLDKINYNSGVSAVVMNYYNHMDKNKVVFDFLVHEEVEDEVRNRLEKNGSQVYVMPPFAISNAFKYLKLLKEFFEKHSEYKIVHGHIPNAAMFYLRSARKANIPIRILHSHSSKGSDIPWKNIRNIVMTKIGVRYSNVYIACSKNAAKYMFGNTDKEIYFLNNAIDTNVFQYNSDLRIKYRKQLMVDDNIVLGHVGRFSEEKNHEFLVKVLAEILKSDNRYKLLLLGDGPRKEYIEQMAKELGINDHIIYMGVVNNVGDYLNAMDVFLLPSFFEGFPVVGVEAQCNGLKCIFSDRITRDTKILPNVEYISIENSDEWASAIQKAELERVLDAAENIKNAGFSIRIEANKLQNMYEDLSQK